MDASRPIRIALVSNGDIDDPTMVSGVPYFVARAFERRADVEVVAKISAKPSRLWRWIVRALTWHPVRTVWDAKYVHSTHLARLRSWKRDWCLRGLQARPDLIIHVRSWYYPPRGRYAAFIDATSDMLQGVTSSWTSPVTTHARKRAIESNFYGLADVTFCASQDAELDLLQGYGVDSARVRVVGGGVNFENYPEEPTRNQTKLKRILFVGKDPERKGLPELLQAFKALRVKHPDATLVIVGCEAAGDVPGVESRGTVASRSEMSELYRSSAIFCMPSRQESFGLVVPEAAAHGLPCVVSNVGELPRLVQHGVTGYVVPPERPSAILEALESLIADPGRAASMGKKGWQITKSLTWDAVVEKMQISTLNLLLESTQLAELKAGGRRNVH